MARRTLRQFAVSIRKRGVAVERNSQKLIINTANEIVETVVIATPADVGTAKSNWLAGINEKPSGTIEAYAPGSKGNTSAVNERNAIDKAKAIIARYRQGSVVHLTNNLPYIGLLNDGYSKQAPAGFVEQAVLKGKEFLRRKKPLSEG